MAPCATQVFQNITDLRYNCLVQKAAEPGITITGNAGQASMHGITIRWKFDPAARTLELQCMNAPFYAPCGTVNNRIHELVDSCP